MESNKEKTDKHIWYQNLEMANKKRNGRCMNNSRL